MELLTKQVSLWSLLAGLGRAGLTSAYVYTPAAWVVGITVGRNMHKKS